MINKIQNDLVQAMRDKDKTKLNVLRALKNAITNASLQKGSVSEQLNDLEILNLIRKQISTRQDSVEQFINAQRYDLVLNETNEIEVLTGYLPVEMTDLHLEEYVVNTITELGATTKKDMGNVIKRVVHLANGRADNKRISKNGW